MYLSSPAATNNHHQSDMLKKNHEDICSRAKAKLLFSLVKNDLYLWMNLQMESSYKTLLTVLQEYIAVRERISEKIAIIFSILRLLLERDLDNDRVLDNLPKLIPYGNDLEQTLKTDNKGLFWSCITDTGYHTLVKKEFFSSWMDKESITFGINTLLNGRNSYSGQEMRTFGNLQVIEALLCDDKNEIMDRVFKDEVTAEDSIVYKNSECNFECLTLTDHFTNQRSLLKKDYSIMERDFVGRIADIYNARSFPGISTSYYIVPWHAALIFADKYELIMKLLLKNFSDSSLLTDRFWTGELKKLCLCLLCLVKMLPTQKISKNETALSDFTVSRQMDMLVCHFCTVLNQFYLYDESLSPDHCCEKFLPLPFKNGFETFTQTFTICLYPYAENYKLLKLNRATDLAVNHHYQFPSRYVYSHNDSITVSLKVSVPDRGGSTEGEEVSGKDYKCSLHMKNGTFSRGSKPITENTVEVEDDIERSISDEDQDLAIRCIAGDTKNCVRLMTCTSAIDTSVHFENSFQRPANWKKNIGAVTCMPSKADIVEPETGVKEEEINEAKLKRKGKMNHLEVKDSDETEPYLEQKDTGEIKYDLKEKEIDGSKSILEGKYIGERNFNIQENDFDESIADLEEEDVDEAKLDQEEKKMDESQSDLEEKEIDDSNADLDVAHSEIQDYDIGETNDDLEVKGVDEAKLDPDNKKMDESQSDLKDIDEAESYLEQNDIGESNSDLKEKEINKSKSSPEEKDLDEANADQEENHINKSNADLEEKDIDETNLDPEEEKMDKSLSDLEEKDMDETNSSLEQKDIGEAMSDLKEKKIDESKSSLEKTYINEADSDQEKEEVNKTMSKLEQKEIDKTKNELDKKEMDEIDSDFDLIKLPCLLNDVAVRKEPFCSDNPKGQSCHTHVKKTEDTECKLRALDKKIDGGGTQLGNNHDDGMICASLIEQTTANKSCSNNDCLDQRRKNSHVQEKSFESSKDVPSFCKEANERNFYLKKVGEIQAAGSFCSLSKHERPLSKEEQNYMHCQKGMTSAYLHKQCYQEKQSDCSASKSVTDIPFNYPTVVEEMKRVQEHVYKELTEIRKFLKELLRDSLSARLQKACSSSKKSKVTNADIESSSSSRHIQKDLNILLDEKTDFEPEDTVAKVINTDSSEHTIHCLKHPSNKTAFTGEDLVHCLSSGCNESSTDEFSSCYPETLSYFQAGSVAVLSHRSSGSHSQLSSTCDISYDDDSHHDLHLEVCEATAMKYEHYTHQDANDGADPKPVKNVSSTYHTRHALPEDIVTKALSEEERKDFHSENELVRENSGETCTDEKIPDSVIQNFSKELIEALEYVKQRNGLMTNEKACHYEECRNNKGQLDSVYLNSNTENYLEGEEEPVLENISNGTLECVEDELSPVDETDTTNCIDKIANLSPSCCSIPNSSGYGSNDRELKTCTAGDQNSEDMFIYSEHAECSSVQKEGMLDLEQAKKEIKVDTEKSKEPERLMLQEDKVSEASSCPITSGCSEMRKSEYSDSVNQEHFADLRGCPVHGDTLQQIICQPGTQQVLKSEEFFSPRKPAAQKRQGRKGQDKMAYRKRKERKLKNSSYYMYHRNWLKDQSHLALPVPVNNKSQSRMKKKSYKFDAWLPRTNIRAKHGGEGFRACELFFPRFTEFKCLNHRRTQVRCKSGVSREVEQCLPMKNGHRNKQVRRDVPCEKFQYQVVSEVDSEIYPSVMSIRSSILASHEKYLDLKTSKKTGRERTSKEFRELESLNSDLKTCLQSLEKAVFRNIQHSNNAIILPGLQSFFDSLRNGETPSFQERMRYEWLRLMSYSAYTGNGSPVLLARNGFLHLSGNETRCFCCNVSYSNWTYTDNVEDIHRRISPNCPYANGGDESGGNIPVESSSVQNEPNQVIPGNIDYGSTWVPVSSQRPAVPANHGGFSCRTTVATTTVASGFNFSTASAGPNPSGFSYSNASGTTGSNQEGQSAGTATNTEASAFHSGMASNTQGPSGLGFSQSVSQQTGGADVTTQPTRLIGSLTIQQSTGVLQPSDEPISGNPVVAPTQPQKVLRQADGDSQLTVSAQQQPGTNELQQSSTRSQRQSEAPGSGAVAPQRENADLIQLGPLKHPRYATMATRISSFQSWPNYLNQTPRQMAYAGFFHPGVADFARCFCCGGGLRNWEADDDPMVEHARWYPRCEYINKLKGTHFIQAVLRRHREHMAERQRQQETAQNQTTFLTPDPMSTSVAANLLDMGFTQDRAREAILTVRRLRGRSEVSVEEVMAWMLDEDTTPHDEPTRTGSANGGRDTVGNTPAEPASKQSPGKSSYSSSESAAVRLQDSDSHTSAEEAQGTKKDTQGATGGTEVKGNLAENKSARDDSSSEEKEKSSKEDISSNKMPTKDKKTQSRKDKSSLSKMDRQSRARKEHSPRPSEGASLLSHGDVDTKSLKEENKVLKQLQVCKICMDRYVSVTFLPCGHLVCCEDCAKNMRKCPICRKRIKGQVRTFMS